ncbi:MAG: SGNH/GDSL hydrolase family protein [Deltaproteobacteria bacterium]|nr:SGNH/GDSL hydrolase family protein [Deltaproteobacteria bacterium]
MKNFLLVCASSAAALLALEIFLRLSGFSYPGFYQYDRAAGSAHRPGAEGWWREEGRGFVKINRFGMRDDREISKKKPSGVYRIAVLGDSYAEAFQVPVGDTFWRVLENKLHACGAFDGKKAEVLNFGVAGYATVQELLTLRSRVWDFQPDMVLLAFLSGNDVRDNHPSLCPAPSRPFFVLQDSSLSLDTALLQSYSFRFKSSSLYAGTVKVLDCFRLYQFIKKAQRDFFVRRHAAPLPKRQPQTGAEPSPLAQKPDPAEPAGTQPGPDIGLDNHIYLPPQSKEWEEAWRITEALLAQMRREVAERGARFLLVSLTNGIQVHPDPKAREAFARSLGCDDLLYPDRRIASFAAAQGIEAIVLAPPMQKRAEQTQRYFHGFPNTSMGGGHWNENGHRVAGEIIAEYLCNQGKNTADQQTGH